MIQIPVGDEQENDGHEQFIVSMTGHEWDFIYSSLEMLAIRQGGKEGEVTQEIADMIHDQVVNA